MRTNRKISAVIVDTNSVTLILPNKTTHELPPGTMVLKGQQAVRCNDLNPDDVIAFEDEHPYLHIPL